MQPAGMRGELATRCCNANLVFLECCRAITCRKIACKMVSSNTCRSVRMQDTWRGTRQWQPVRVSGSNNQWNGSIWLLAAVKRCGAPVVLNLWADRTVQRTGCCERLRSTRRFESMG